MGETDGEGVQRIHRSTSKGQFSNEALQPHSCPSAPSPADVSLGCPLAASSIPLPAGSPLIAGDPQTPPFAVRPLQLGTSPLPLGQDQHFGSLWDGEESGESSRTWAHTQHPRALQKLLVTMPPCLECPRTGLGSMRAGAGGAKGVAHGHVSRVPQPLRNSLRRIP